MSEYQYPYTNIEGKIICQICGKPFLVISPKHLANHKVTYSEYKIRFPEAPLSSKEFAAKGKYGKEKHLFVKEALDEMEETDVYEIKSEPDIEDEIDFKKQLDINPNSSDICNISKDKILDHLRSFFTNIKKDYMIQIFSIDGRMIYETISDFADPVLRVNVEFPKTFWHNRASYDDPNRISNLQEFGWKVITIDSIAPSFKDISKAVQKY